MIKLETYFGRLGNQMFQYAFLYAFARKNNIDFYFQDIKWFKGYENEIVNMFSEGVVKSDYVAVHVRRGDYVGHPLYVDLTETDYYEKATQEFVGEKLMIFSDDIAWCKEYFDGYTNVEFCEETDPVKSLNLMAGCKSVIMANSTFSWWAGFLCTGTVIAPRLWFKGKEKPSYKDEWKII